MRSQSRTRSTVSELVQGGHLRVLYQPIVDLETGSVVGHEALARGPEGSPLERPVDLFRAAADEGRTKELDSACRKIALDGALGAGLGSANMLFLNVEPGGLDIGGVLDVWSEEHMGRVSVVIELTERALTTRPSEVLAAVRWLRERNCRIALDDVGIDKRSLALMPFLAPDIIKLDIAVTQERMPTLDTARVLSAVGAEVERTGAVVLAEGIETEEHLSRARAMGAKLGQGWLLGRPGSINTVESDAGGPVEVPSRAAEIDGAETPFDRIADVRAMRCGDENLLRSLSRQLEQEAIGLAGEAVVLATFQHPAYFTHQTRRRYERAAETAALVGALGIGMAPEPAAGVRGADLDPDDHLAQEWDVIVIAPHFAGAFVAREVDRSPQSDEGDRQFNYFVTYERELAIEAARPLLARMARSL